MMEGFTSPKTSPMLAPEIWDTIFRDVHSKDFLAAINTCMEWNHLLHSRKTTELFGQVLPFIMRWLPKKDFLNLRLASRGWKEELDDVYENHPARLASTTSDLEFPELASDEDSADELEEKVNEEGRMVPAADCGMIFDRLDELQRFLQDVDGHSRNPFPGKCVWIIVEEYLDGENEVDRTELLERFTQLLVKFGKYIWYLRLTFDCPDNPMHSTEYETQLMSWLALVPNLKRLKLQLGAPIDGDECDALNVDYWRQNPVEKLSNLQVFSYFNRQDGCGFFSPLIIELLERFCANGNLKRLHLPHFLYYPGLPLPDLEELWAVTFYGELSPLKENSPKLQKLTLFLDGVRRPAVCNGDCEEENHDSIAKAFDDLHFFADTLKELVLLGSNRFCFSNTMDFKGELPKLERLALNYSSNIKIDFLLNLKSLKHLELLCSPMDDYNNGEFVCRVFKRLTNVKTIVIWQDLIEYKPQRFVFRRLC